MMRFLMACSLVLALAGGEARAADASLDALYAAAKGEKPLTWYQVPLPQAVGEEIATAFAQQYPGLVVQTQRNPAQTLFEKIGQEIKADAPGADLFTSSVVNHLATLKQQGKLLRFTPNAAATLTDAIPGVKGIDPDGYYYSTVIDDVGIVYNTKLLKAGDGPKSYQDLLNPAWRGKFAVPNPAASGTFGALTVSLHKTYGKAYFDALAKNDAMVVRSLPDALAVVQSGERMLAITTLPFALAAKQRGQPVDVIYPTDGILISICPTGILSKTHSPNSAKLFMEFLLSRKVSEIVARAFNEPLHDGVAVPEGMKHLSTLKVILPTEAEMASTLPVVIEEWRDAFGM